MKLSEKMIVPNQQKEENFLMKVSRPPTSNKRPTTNHLQKSPNRGHRVIYVKKDVEQRPSTTSSIVPQYKTPRYVPYMGDRCRWGHKNDELVMERDDRGLAGV